MARKLKKIKKFDIEPLNAYEDNKDIIIVPNLELSKSKIVNFTYGQEKLNKKDNTTYKKIKLDK